MIRKYIVDTRVCPFQADGQFEDGSYFHIRYRNSKVFIGVYSVPTWDRNTNANAFYSESYTTSMVGSEDSMNDVEAMLMLERFYPRYLEETTHLSEE
tara:strand:+ start:497 stop:787 length:291 start_codon:yes stop_codon:yes gene_type:complete